ncbi:MAG: Ig-like domain-containing protein [Clostridia bacterium]|nr:Ig-like domain-containing protein [Clostridia bacterium]
MIIPKMYDIEITSSDYNPDINTSLTITATATDYNGNPVIGETLTIKHNGTTVGTPTTNSNGVATVTTTCGSAGTHQFTCKSASCIVSVNPYPVGSIYIATNNTDPSTLFGGLWTQIEDRFLLASGTNYTLGDTGGTATVTLTANQSGVKAHTHNVGSGRMIVTRSTHSDGVGETGTASGTHHYSPSINKSDNWYGVAETGSTSSNASEAHNNMPPYLVVTVWERLS